MPGLAIGDQVLRVVLLGGLLGLADSGLVLVDPLVLLRELIRPAIPGLVVVHVLPESAWGDC
ncbi:hypothetical protein ACFTSF_05125 [Kribbella sp. NPDC056951]|uniref:hypothetical protein n=1 Tax=Kribbella sp. NPDC056951 TaxID=3345978 RepID=UPI00363195FF